MNYHSLYSAVSAPIETCLVGSGAFGASFLSQARHTRLVNARIAVDLTVDLAAKALVSAGFAADSIALCETASDAKAAWDSGKAIAAARLETVIDLPFSMMIESTGAPEATARHARLAIESGRHVALASKEADSVIGPGLAALAARHGVRVTPVDGDQPSLLISLISWAETLGLEIIAAGKSSEYDFVLERSGDNVTSNGVSKTVPGITSLMTADTLSAPERAAERTRLLGASFPLRAVPDLCELQIVANATGLAPDTPALHATPARISDLPELFASSGSRGVLAGTQRLDVFHHLRFEDEASFAGGVFVIVRCMDDASWQILAGKGHVVRKDRSSAMLYLPRHLLGVEAATSIIETAGLGMSGYGDDYQPRQELVAVAETHLEAGSILSMGGHHHSISGVAAEIRPAKALAPDSAAPFYLAANRKLVRDVAAGAAIRLDDLDMTGDSPLLELRRWQDQHFFGAP